MKIYHMLLRYLSTAANGEGLKGNEFSDPHAFHQWVPIFQFVLVCDIDDEDEGEAGNEEDVVEGFRI